MHLSSFSCCLLFFFPAALRPPPSSMAGASTRARSWPSPLLFLLVSKGKREAEDAVWFSSSWGWSNADGVHCVRSHHCCFLAGWILKRSLFLCRFQIWLRSCHPSPGMYRADVAAVFQAGWLAMVIDGHVTGLRHRNPFFGDWTHDWWDGILQPCSVGRGKERQRTGSCQLWHGRAWPGKVSGAFLRADTNTNYFLHTFQRRVINWKEIRLTENFSSFNTE